METIVTLQIIDICDPEYLLTVLQSYPLEIISISNKYYRYNDYTNSNIIPGQASFLYTVVIKIHRENIQWILSKLDRHLNINQYYIENHCMINNCMNDIHWSNNNMNIPDKKDDTIIQNDHRKISIL